MKRVLLLLIIFLSIINASYSQTCPNQIDISATNVCGLYGDAQGNSNWDWEIDDPLDPSYCNNWYARTGPNTYLTLMGSPFVNPSTEKLQIISTTGDFKKEKGWELLRRNFGCLANVANPYFMLYNKYTGLCRVYVYIPSTGETYSEIAITVKPVSTTRPAMHSHTAEIMTAPDKYLTNQAGSNEDEMQIIITKSAGMANWVVSEFYLTFDPNIQSSNYANTSFECTVYGVVTNNIVATIEGTTTTETLSSYAYRSAAPTSQNNLSSFIAANKKAINYFKSINDAAAGLNDAATKLGLKLGPKDLNTSALNGIRNALDLTKLSTTSGANLSKALGQVGDMLGAYGSVLNFIGTFVSIASGGQGAPEPAPLITTYNLLLNGTMTAKTVVQSFIVRNPGISSTAQNNNNATYYNHPVGIFNFLKTPKVDTLPYERNSFIRYEFNGVVQSGTGGFPTTQKYVAYRLKEDLEVSFPQSAGLEIHNIKVALIAKLPESTLANNSSIQTVPNPYVPYWPVFHENPTLKRTYIKAQYTGFYFNHLAADIQNGRIEISKYDIGDDNLKRHEVKTNYVDITCARGLSLNVPKGSQLYIRVLAVLNISSDPQKKPIYYAKDYLVDKSQGNLAEIPSNVSTSLSALPPYANYTVAPNVTGGSPNTIIIGTTPSTPPKLLQISSGPGEYKANWSLTTQDRVIVTSAALITFRAGASITLNPGFVAEKTSTFLATTSFGYNVNCFSAVVSPYVFPGNTYNSSIISSRKNNVEQPLLQLHAPQSATLFPNPVSTNYVTLRLGKLPEDKVSVKFINTFGNVVLNKLFAPSNSILLDVSKLSSGTYFVQVITKDFSHKEKLIIVKN